MAGILRLAVRDWDWVTPLLLGEVDLTPVRSLGLDLVVDRVGALPDLWGDEQFDLAETSLSRYSSAVAGGRHEVRAVPHMLMQGFRHRCVLVPRTSPATAPADLVGSTIGVTGWPDSGNTWTRAVLAEAGLGIEDARWLVGRLTAQHDHHDRLAGFGRPGHIEAAPERPLLDLMADGWLSAVLTPFMPPGFYRPHSPWRSLWSDVRAEETAYAGRTGFVPGHHLLGFRRHVPLEAVHAVSDVLVASRAVWRRKREKYGDTSTWLVSDLLAETRALPEGWDAPGVEAQGPMVEEFCRQQRLQGILADPPSLTDLFPDPVRVPETGGLR